MSFVIVAVKDDDVQVFGPFTSEEKGFTYIKRYCGGDTDYTFTITNIANCAGLKNLAKDNT